MKKSSGQNMATCHAEEWDTHKEIQMRRKLSVIVAFLLFVCLDASATEAKDRTELKTPAEKVSYALGLDIGASLKRFQSGLEFDALFQGIEDSLRGSKPLLTQQEAAEIKSAFFNKIQQELAEKNLKEGQAFLAENKKKEGVITTASGLQYMVLKEGDGPKPEATDRVSVHYRGTLLDGTEFDSSFSRGRPATFQVQGVIAGWTEALQLMKVGSKYRLFIPSNLAYRERGAGQQIGPNAMLIFEVELLSIEN
jgi:FKBP-type peptidyl-prolyl cis-trans isomerase FklB